MTMRPHKKARSIHGSEWELDGGEAFVSDVRHGFVPIEDDDVEAFGEEFIAGATSNEAVGETARDETYAEEAAAFGVAVFDEEAFDRVDTV